MINLSKDRILKNYYLLGLLGFSMLVAGCTDLKGFPDKKEIDSIFQENKYKAKKEKRLNDFNSILSRSNDPKNKSEDEIVKYMVNKMTQYFLKTHDEVLLSSIEKIKADAGFGNFICIFYKNIKSEKKFIDRFKKNKDFSALVMRCVGVSFDRRELDF